MTPSRGRGSSPRAARAILVGLGLAILVGGCLFNGDDTAEGTVEGTGTVQYQNLEGGFFGIVADDGARYDPVNLPEELRQDGLRVRFRGRLLKEGVSIHMWGAMVELERTERLP